MLQQILEQQNPLGRQPHIAAAVVTVWRSMSTLIGPQRRTRCLISRGAVRRSSARTLAISWFGLYGLTT